MAIEGVGSQTSGVQQQLLANNAADHAESSGGSLQTEVGVSVLADSLNQQEEQASQLLESLGIGQNVDIQA